MLLDQINGFTLHPRDGCTRPPITSTDNMPSDIKMLEKYFALQNPCWIKQHGKSVRRKAEGIEVDPPKPKKKSSNSKFDDDVVLA